MRWTKRHSKNAVAAKARKRMAEVETPPIEYSGSVYKPRRSRPDFTVRIEDRFGERLQISIHRFMGRVHVQGGLSVRQLCRGLEHLITKSA